MKEQLKTASEIFRKHDNGKPVQKLTSLDGINIQNYNESLCFLNQFVI